MTENDEGRIFSELREIHKLCQNFYAGRLRTAEAELDTYHDAEKGNLFDDILTSIARIYIDHESLPDSVEDEGLRRRIEYILLDILQVLEGYGVHIHRSNINEPRNLRYTQTVNYTETDDVQKHGLTAESISPGFYRENKALIRELISIYRTSRKEVSSCQNHQGYTE